MGKQDTTLDRLRFRIFDKRVDASAYTQEYLEWVYAVDELNRSFHIPRAIDPHEDEEEGDTLTARKKLDLGLIDEEEYYNQVSSQGIKLPDKPEHDWLFTPSVIDLEQVTGFLQYPKDNSLSIVNTQAGFHVLVVPFKEFYEIMIDYRQRKYGKRDLIEILSKFKESESFDEGEDICQ